MTDAAVGPGKGTPTPHALDVIVVDDDESARVAMCAAVQAFGHHCRLASSGHEALGLQEAHPSEVIVVGRRTAGMGAVDFCQRVRALSGGGYVYVLLASPHAAKRALVEAAKAGSDGCLSTPIDLESLEAQLIVAARITRAYRALTESNLSLRHDSRASFRAARLDPLTHVSNRLRLDEDLETLQEHVSRYDRGVAIAMCDLDEFKRYNDHYGHLAGDVALQRVAHAIRKSLRRADPVYRYGGEEFLAILHEQARDDAALAVERARAAVHDLGIVHAPTAQHPVLTVSIGLAIVATEGGRSVHAAIARADHALYRAKAAGRNNVTLEDEPDHRSQDNPRDKVVHRVTGRRS